MWIKMDTKQYALKRKAALTHSYNAVYVQIIPIELATTLV